MAYLCAISLCAFAYIIPSTVLCGPFLQMNEQELRKVRQLTQGQAESKG